ncbi:MAG: enoyl-CoA hydratase/isomerase family protein [Novosphingobium sp.]|nr:enoyl-CoA hydratase/isomerase family protein [Novosphingobium sp.]
MASDGEAGPLIVTVSEGLCTLTLNRPEKRNALDGATFAALDAALERIENDETIACVVLRGAGKAFSAGADLGGVGTGSGGSPHANQKIVERLANLPVPTVAAIHGICFTGGLELALGCDVLIADSSARFADTHGKWGFVGTWGISQRLPRRIGLMNAKSMMFTSRTVEADEALEMGLVWQVVEEGGLDEAVAAFAAQVLANSAHTNRSVKRLLTDTEGMPLAEALAHEKANYVGMAPDYRERLSAFSKKG